MLGKRLIRLRGKLPLASSVPHAAVPGNVPSPPVSTAEHRLLCVWNRSNHGCRCRPRRSFDSSTLLQSVTVSATTGDKPQSKVWESDGTWFSVLPDSTGTWMRRLDGNNWTSVLKLSSDSKVHADVKPDGDLVHVLLFDGTKSQLETLQFVAGPKPTYQSWTLNPKLVDVVLSKGVEMATIDLDSTGRMWLASDAVNTIEVRVQRFSVCGLQ